MNDADFTTEDTEITEKRKRINAVTERVIGAAIEVHKALGPGLLESCYEMCLCHQLGSGGIAFQRQHSIPVHYKGIQLDCGFRADRVVENTVVVELKAIESILPIHEAQLMSYLKLSKLSAGLLINFNVPLLKQGIKRRLLNPEILTSF
jgi:GxxExxY protein